MTKIENIVLATIKSVKENKLFNKSNLNLKEINLKQHKGEDDKTFAERKIKFARKIAFVNELSRVSGEKWCISPAQNGQWKYYTAKSPSGSRIYLGTSDDYDLSSVTMSVVNSLKARKSAYIVLSNAHMTKAILVPALDFAANVNPSETLGKVGNKYVPVQKLSNRFAAYRAI